MPLFTFPTGESFDTLYFRLSERDEMHCNIYILYPLHASVYYIESELIYLSLWKSNDNGHGRDQTQNFIEFRFKRNQTKKDALTFIVR